MKTSIIHHPQIRQLVLIMVITLSLETTVIQPVSAQTHTNPNHPTASTSTTLTHAETTTSSSTKPSQTEPIGSEPNTTTTSQPSSTSSTTLHPAEPSTTNTTQSNGPDPTGSVPTSTSTLPPVLSSSTSIPMDPAQTTSTTSSSGLDQAIPQGSHLRVFTPTTTTLSSARLSLNPNSYITPNGGLNPSNYPYPIPTDWVTMTYEIGEYPSIRNIQLQVNQQAEDISLLVDGGTYTGMLPIVRPPLPNGLSITFSGQLAGTPTQLSPYTVYTLYCDWPWRCNNGGFGLEVVQEIKPFVGFPNDQYQLIFGLNEDINHTFWHVRGGEGTLCYLISPSLPSGLYYNIRTGKLWGRVTEAPSRTEYTLSVSDSNGRSDRQRFSIVFEEDTRPEFSSETEVIKLYGSNIVNLPRASGGNEPYRYKLMRIRPSGSPNSWEELIAMLHLNLGFGEIDTSIEIVNDRMISKQETIPFLYTNYRGFTEEMNNVYLNVIDRDGDGDIVRLSVVWEEDTNPIFDGSMNRIKLVSDRMDNSLSWHIPNIVSGNLPLTLSVSPPLPQNFSVSNSQYDDFAQFNRALLLYEPDETWDREHRQTHELVVTDADGDTASVSFLLTIRHGSPIIKDAVPLVHNWTYGIPIPEFDIEIEQKVGQLCDNPSSYGFPEGIDVKRVGRAIRVSGTPVPPEVLTNKASPEFNPDRLHIPDTVIIPFRLAFTCAYGWSGGSYNSPELSWTINYTNQSVSFDDADVGGLRELYRWTLNQPIDPIFIKIRDGELPFSIRRSEENLPQGIRSDIIDPQECNAIGEALACLKIHGTPTRITPQGDFVVFVDDGDGVSLDYDRGEIPLVISVSNR